MLRHNRQFFFVAVFAFFLAPPSPVGKSTRFAHYSNARTDSVAKLAATDGHGPCQPRSYTINSRQDAGRNDGVRAFGTRAVEPSG